MIPRPGICGAVVDEVCCRIVCDKSPCRPTSDAPGVWRPRLHSEICTFIAGIKRFESRSNQYFDIGSRVVSLPGEFAVAGIESGKPATHSELTPRIADEHVIVDHDRSHRDGFTLLDIGEMRLPQLLACVRVKRDRVAIERIEKDFSAIENSAARNPIAACFAFRGGRGTR